MSCLVRVSPRICFVWFVCESDLSSSETYATLSDFYLCMSSTLVVFEFNLISYVYAHFLIWLISDANVVRL